MTVTFDDDDLPARLDSMSEQELHGLAFGVIGLDEEGRVAFFSDREREESGYGDDEILGLDFFASVAPCMNREDVRSNIVRQLQAGSLDLEFGHTGDHADRNRFFRVRAMSRAAGGMWLAHQR